MLCSTSALLYSLISSFILVQADVTVYYVPGQEPIGASSPDSTSPAAATYTGAAAYNPTVLNPPPVPNPPITTSFSIQIPNDGAAPAGASIAQKGSFYGFSVEMSVVNRVLGKNSSLIQVPFLNLMANIQQRAGRVNIRVGGNTQDFAVVVDSLPDGIILQKDENDLTNPSDTPPLDISTDMFTLMRDISSLVDVRWFLGIPFNVSSDFRLAIAEQGESILGDYLIGLQAGNEPDLYVAHGHRPSTYGPYDYFGEVGNLVVQLGQDGNIPNPNLLVAPNIASGGNGWTPEMVWNTGFVTSYGQNMAFLGVEHYPTDNCAALYNDSTDFIFHDPQTTFPNFLNHTSGQLIVQPYLNSTAYLQSLGKQLLMMETNTASCGGFPGISDSFGAALWALDYGMQMAYSNFSGAFLHVGGEDDYYNPFTPPPTNQSSFRQWTIGPVYYSALIMAEALGPSNTSQIIDLAANNGNIYTPAYAIYENGQPVRVALFNYVTDPSGASTYTASISIGDGDGGTPSQVQVKYLSAASVSQKGNFTWAGQTFGNSFESDGRLQGSQDIQTVSCSSSNNTCSISVPAPGFALVFLSQSALTDSTSAASATTFSTSTLTLTANTATIDPSVLATSNGHTGMDDHVLGSTSKGSAESKTVRVGGVIPSVGLLTVVTITMVLSGAVLFWH